MRRDSHELAWAAGFFDGEGSTCLRLHRPKRLGNSPNPVLYLCVSQKDRRALDRFRAALGGVGSIYGPDKRAGIHRFQVGQRKARRAVELMWPWLGEVKREQAIAAIAGYTEMRGLVDDLLYIRGRKERPMAGQLAIVA